MATDCELVQEALAEHRGDEGPLDEAARRHLGRCPACSEVAAQERALSAIFRAALPPADRALEAAVLAALPAVRWRRRVIAFLPVAASLVIAVIGAVLVGGVPAVGILGLLPAWSGQAGLAAAGGASDWYQAVTAGMQAAAAAVTPRTLVAASIIGLLGLSGVVTMALRWRKISPWRGRG